MNIHNCHWQIAAHKHDTVWANVGCFKFCENHSQKLVVVIIDKHLNFNDYVLSIYKTAGRKLSVLVRISGLLNLEQ